MSVCYSWMICLTSSVILDENENFLVLFWLLYYTRLKYLAIQFVFNWVRYYIYVLSYV